MSRVSPVVLIFALLLVGCSEAPLPSPGEVLDMQVKTGPGVVGPRLEIGADDVLRLSWMERGDEGATLRFASLAGGRFGRARDVVTDERMFVNWADLPSVNALADGTLVAFWLRYSADETYSYDVVVAYSDDQGLSWSVPHSPHDDGTPTEHGFVSLYDAGGKSALLWLDGRDTGGPHTDNVLDTSMTLRAAEMAAEGTRMHELLVDDSVCDCCQTDVAVASEGPIAVYRNRTADEIRDIYITRFENGRWQPGTPLHEDNWQISACPVNGPAIVADGEFVAVAWFTAASQPLVQLTLSRDGGRTFAPPIEIASGGNKGRVGIALVPGDLVAVTWAEKGPDENDLVRLRLVDRDGRAGPAESIGASGLLRMYPQLASADDDLIAAWTDGDANDTRLVVRRVSVRRHD